ncbi:MAG: adenosylcobinamide-GDP ribazoletransferase [Brevinematales bacterium]|jgi:adenosylcobinamide-GDP ribazoletransferase
MKNWLSALFISITVLTRIPLPFREKIIYSNANFARSVSFFPLAGLIFGLVSAAIYCLLNIIIHDTDIMAFILLVIPFFLNKFFHLDGLADTFDAFLADRTKEERLVILKDSRTGSFALGGVVLFLLLKFILLKKLLVIPDFLPLLIIIPVLSRYGIAMLSSISKYPREEGTGKNFIGTAGPLPVLIASFFTFLIIAALLMLSGWQRKLPDFFLYTWAGIIPAVFLIRSYSNKKIGGVTGDVLGASAETLEVLTLVLILAVNSLRGLH